MQISTGYNRCGWTCNPTAVIWLWLLDGTRLGLLPAILMSHIILSASLVMYAILKWWLVLVMCFLVYVMYNSCSIFCHHSMRSDSFPERVANRYIYPQICFSRKNDQLMIFWFHQADCNLQPSEGVKSDNNSQMVRTHYLLHLSGLFHGEERKSHERVSWLER